MGASELLDRLLGAPRHLEGHVHPPPVGGKRNAPDNYPRFGFEKASMIQTFVVKLGLCCSDIPCVYKNKATRDGKEDGEKNS